MSLKIRLSRGGREKTPVLPHRRRRRPHAARRPLHRAARHLRPVEGEGFDRATGDRRGKSRGLDHQGRAADRSCRPPPRNRRRRQARTAQQSRQGLAEEEGAGTRRRQRRRGREGCSRLLRSRLTPIRGGRILVGRFGAPHGVRGEVRLQSFTQDPAALARYGILGDETGQRRFAIAALRPVKDNLFVARVTGIADRTAAAALTNIDLFVERAALPPPDDDEFYLADLIGLEAVDDAGAPVGTVIAMPNYGAGDILEIASPNGGETLLLPFTKAVVPTIDLARRRLTVVMPDETVDPQGAP